MGKQLPPKPALAIADAKTATAAAKTKATQGPKNGHDNIRTLVIEDAQPPPKERKRTLKHEGVEICFVYNNKDGCKKADCGRAHVCQYCFSDKHETSQCTG